jgi:hypothetical protein
VKALNCKCQSPPLFWFLPYGHWIEFQAYLFTPLLIGDTKGVALQLIPGDGELL